MKNVKPGFIIETRRLVLRELEAGDAGELSKVLSDAESMRYYPHPFSNAEVKAWIEKNIKRYSDFGFGLWAVIRKEDGVFLGDCGITMQNIDGEMLPEIGFHIILKYCKNGYATEAARACLDYALKKLKYNSVYSYTRASNVASQCVAVKIGMKEKKRYEKDGFEHVVYEYIKDAYI